MRYKCPKCGKKFGGQNKLSGHMNVHRKGYQVPRGKVSVAELAKRLGTHLGTIHNWVETRRIPAGVRTATRRYWTGAEATAIEERVAKYKSRLERFGIGFRQNPDKSWSCPAGCGFKTTAPGGVVSHLKACKLVWDGPAKREVKELVLEPKEEKPVLTRAELLAWAEAVIDGRTTVQEFAERVVAHRVKVKMVEDELRWLCGK